MTFVPLSSIIYQWHIPSTINISVNSCMLLGEALIEAGLISKAHLHEALAAQASNPNLSLGEIITQLYDVPRDMIESHYITLAIIPRIKEWLQKQLNKKEFSDGLPTGSVIADIAISVSAFSRYKGDIVSFKRIEGGLYRESSALQKMEKILTSIDSLIITTTKQQKVELTNIDLEVNLQDKGVRPDNPGFLAELNLRIQKTFKGKV